MNRLIYALCIATISLIPIVSSAQNITFEPDGGGFLPDGSTAIDDMVISNQFLRQGVMFGFDNDLNGLPDPEGWPALERVGADGNDGYYVTSPSGNDMDIAVDGTSDQLGQYFLRTVAVAPDTKPDTLIISYITPVKHASGEIWDIDASDVDYEQWRIEALDANQQVITNLLTPEGIHYDQPESLDGLPWSFEISAGESNEISALRFVCSGSRTQFIGLAFNNFSPAQSLGSTNIIGVAKIVQATEIYWHSQVGKIYQPQWSQGLGGQWHDLGASLVGTGTEMSVLDSTRNTKNRLYRILEIN